LTLPALPNLEIPTGQVTRAEGDVHPLGNPPMANPENGLRIAKGIRDKLSKCVERRCHFAQRTIL